METEARQNPAEAATKNGGNATQEVSSTTPAQVEPTKRSLRLQTWNKLKDLELGEGFNRIFNRIPSFVDKDKAAALLAGTEEFKKAKEIKIQIDRALHAAKLQALIDGKTLYLPSTRDSKALYLKVEVPADATEEQKNEILSIQDLQKHRTEINLADKVKLDMVIIGSVVVSRDGYRIGRGNGFNDLDIGLLIQVGSITPDTVIATLVHDVQLVDSLPTNLFQKYDTPVDLIITPTEVIRVAKRLPRPSGIYWELLSERRLKIVSVLQELKEAEEKDGKIITLKEEDTDIESNRYQGRRRFMNRRFGGGRGRYQRGRGRSQNNNTEGGNTDQQQGGDNPDQQQGGQQRRQPRRRRFVNNRRRRATKSEGDQSGVESKSQDRGNRSGGDGGGNRRRRFNSKRPQRHFSVKVTNIAPEVRVKDLKTELRKRQCNPMTIAWKGVHGRCYLHFGSRSGKPSSEEEMEKIMQALNDLSLTINPSTDEANNGEENAPTQEPKVVNLKCELINYADRQKANNNNASVNGEGGAEDAAAAGGDGGDGSAARIESVDTTTV